MAEGIYIPPVPVNEAVLDFFPGSLETKQLKEELHVQSCETVSVPLVIGGREINTTKQYVVTSPHDRERKIACLSEVTQEHMSKAIESAVQSASGWSNLPWQERAAVFLKAADLLSTKYRNKINAATMLAQSKTCFQAEIDAACELIDFLRFNVYFAHKIFLEQPLYSPKGQWNRSQYRGLEGFVFAVGPFNFTSISVNLATAPALMGCSVVWKPAPAAMLASYYVLKILEEAGLPPGVINLIGGDPQICGDTALAHMFLSYFT